MVETHGSDYKAMVRDRKLNVYQFTEQQIKKKLIIYLRQEQLAYPEEYKKIAEEEGVDPECFDAGNLIDCSTDNW